MRDRMCPDKRSGTDELTRTITKSSKKLAIVRNKGNLTAHRAATTWLMVSLWRNSDLVRRLIGPGPAARWVNTSSGSPSFPQRHRWQVDAGVLPRF